MTLTVFKWREVNAVLFNDPKSGLIHDHNKRKNNDSDEVKVTLPNSTVIETTEVQRWLGI